MSVLGWRRIGGSVVYALLALALVLAGSIASGAEKSKTDLLWFDPTQLPSFAGTVDRFEWEQPGRSCRPNRSPR
jgi:hypothetical protein